MNQDIEEPSLSSSISSLNLEDRLPWQSPYDSLSDDETSISNETAPTVESSAAASIPSSPPSNRRSSLRTRTNRSSISARRHSGGIRFGSVCVHTHLITLGDNPAVSVGSPIALDWQQIKCEEYNVDEFEALQRNRRKKASRIPVDTREAWLRESGHTTDRLNRTSAEINFIKAERFMAHLDLDALDEYRVLANVSRKQTRAKSASSEKNNEKRPACQVTVDQRAATGPTRNGNRIRRAFSRWSKRTDAEF